MPKKTPSLVAIVPAAGVGSRMQADRPKQYLSIGERTVLEHTLNKLLAHPLIAQVVVAISDDDPYFAQLPIANSPQVIRVSGGKERADSVLSGLKYVQTHLDAKWVLVHDAARPCVSFGDIDALISACLVHPVGGILATPVRDTMKRANAERNIDHTVSRDALWHALTPQMFQTQTLAVALEQALAHNVAITDEASALEWQGLQPALIPGKATNIKITQPEDLALAEFYLSRAEG
ncbi:2-C-methyl-D-erythritol 4-phosphate cytidylyltransferase [Vibrio navarrensis]|uniref:2-C-methyl-D-erythritol 4-phosphate cytidylyltransferase n=1 Tax=Vibrio navarrensis TaxID=29495 RepID=UPI00192F2159|nr:2-C-methyl-D-erythritol 4-phosphate cytidylyltransferase [Vibrio navarrensis]MBE3669303.1 2-C-methyl-D-erythritol 4-phosphate cytidylyltransferase [Vibrio navarrensis]